MPLIELNDFNSKHCFLAQANWRQTALALLRLSRLNDRDARTLRGASPCFVPPSDATTARAPLLKNPRLVPSEYAVLAAGRPLGPIEGLVSEFLYKRWLRSHMDISSFLPPPPHGDKGAPSMKKANASNITPSSFFQMFDATCQPVLLHEAITDWPGQ